MFDDIKQKTLKITEALYRTTDLFSDAEPLKWSMRQNALDILNCPLSGSPQDIGHINFLVKDIFLKLELATGGTFISKTNFEVLRRAYSELLEEVSSVKDSYKNLLDSIVNLNETKQISDNQIKVLPKNVVGTKEENENHEEEVKNEGVIKREIKHEDVTRTWNINRKEALILALKTRGPVSVGDLAKALVEAGTQVSEKTVQRELGTLVATGAIKQEGEKRWRRYFL